MSKFNEQDDNRPDDEQADPTRSFDGSTVGPGSQIGTFQIEKELGRGAMGVVYLARDTKLDRSVAIKSLPSEVMANPKARSRFSREARVLASLNHPNIATIYDEFEEVEGVRYLVLEYVPGQTLAERVAKSRLKLEESLSIALQIAEAVAAAHDRDVIHRDLKPGNIKITPEGKVKVLDFGLAKAVGGRAVDQQSTVTEPGRVIGTPAYMSPEQARGKTTDKRGDIWSFGCILYEMLTSRIPFRGETISDTLANILQTEPDWQALPESTPANIRSLLRHCLAKEPNRRLQHMGDAVLEIDETRTLPAYESGITRPASSKARRSSWRLAGACGLAGLIVGLIVCGLFPGRPAAPSLPKSSPSSILRATINLPEDQVLGCFPSSSLGGSLPAFDLSPDGSQLVYAAEIDGRTQLYLRLTDQFEAKPIPGTGGASSPFFSHDGQSVGYFVDQKLTVVSLRGGEPITVCEANMISSGSWGDDGMIYFTGQGGLSRVSGEGSDSESLGTSSDPIEGRYPQVLPGGEAVLVTSGRGAMHVSLATMEKTLLVPDVLYARYVSTGHLVYVRAGAIEAVPFDLGTLKKTGSSAPVVPNILLDSVYGVAQYAFSNNGLLVYAPGSDTGRTVPVWVDRQGIEEPLNMPAQNYGMFKLSPNGKRLAITVAEVRSNIHIYDVATGMGNKLTLEGDNFAPVWTPDGEHVTFSRRMKGEENMHILCQRADGSGETKLLHSSQHGLSPFSWSSDGKLLAFVLWDYPNAFDIWVLSRGEDPEPKLILGKEARELFPAFSPDPSSQWIAYTSDREGMWQVYVQPYPDMDRPTLISFGLGEMPIWSSKGDELFYRSNNKWVVASISTEPEFIVHKREVRFEGDYLNVGGVSYDVAPDGRLLVLKPQHDSSEVRELCVVNNWFEELKQKAPPRKD